MSYNEMQLSSEVAHPSGDDDIDIDIDFHPSHNDEDYILEDVRSDNSHEISNDDLMVDDENTSYTLGDVNIVNEQAMVNMQMEDADFMEVHEPDSFDSGMNIGSEDPNILPVDVDEIVMARVDESLTTEAFLDVEDTDIIIETANEDTADLASQKEAHRPDSFSEVLNLGQQSSQEQSSPMLKYAQSDQEHNSVVSDYQQTAIGDGRYSDTEEKVEMLSSSMNSPIPVIVIYQNVEYSLIATSESDDPDTYFLQDGALTKAPLIDFFAALRDVIHEDLAVEDELCLSLDDLSLEISETCASVYETTFNSVMELYVRLFNNDGVGTPVPIRVTLGTKLDFAKRFEILLAGAAQGKGLSEFILYDDESENHEDAGKYDGEEKNDLESTGDTVADEHPSGLVGLTEAAKDEIKDNLLAGDGVVAERTSKHDTTYKLETVELDDNPNSASGVKSGIEPGKHTSSPSSLMLNARSTSKAATIAVQQIGHANRSTSDVDEDGDLIDYSDEAYQQEAQGLANVKKEIDKNSSTQDGNTPALPPTCLKPKFCFCPTCTDESLLTAFKETEKTLEQPVRSGAAGKDARPPTSLSFEENPQFKSQLDEGKVTQNSDGRSDFHENDTEDVEQDFQAYEQHLERDYDDSQGPEIDKEVDTDNFEENQAPFDEVEQAQDDAEDNLFGLKYDEVREVADRDNRISESTPNYDDLEIDYELRDQDPESGQTSGLMASDINSEQLNEATGDMPKYDEDEIGYEDDDIPEFNQSDHTLVADESSYNSEDHGNEDGGNVQVLEDEINYETDDHEDLGHPVENKNVSTTSPEPNRMFGKRRRGDTQDATQQSSKQSKRARS